MKKLILVTGVAGFIGSRVAQKLLSLNHNVLGIDDLSSGKYENIPKGIKFVEADLSDAKIFSDLPQNIDRILHLAGQSSGEQSFDNPARDLEKNTVSTINLINFGIKNNCDRIVYASSMSVYGDTEEEKVSETSNCAPLSCYGVSKLASEKYLKIFSNKLNFVSLRMFNVYGPGQNLLNLKQGMVSIFLAQAFNEGTINVRGRLDRFRDFIFIDDVVEIWIKASFDKNVINNIFNVGTGKKTKVNELLDEIKRNIGNVDIETSNKTPGDQFGIYSDNTKLNAKMNLNSFTPLRGGIRKFAHHIRNSMEP